MKLNKDQFNKLRNAIADIVNYSNKAWVAVYWKETPIGKDSRDINHFITLTDVDNLVNLQDEYFDRHYSDKDIYMSINGTEFMYSSVEDRKLNDKQTDATQRAYMKGFNDGLGRYRDGGRYI